MMMLMMMFIFLTQQAAREQLEAREVSLLAQQFTSSVTTSSTSSSVLSCPTCTLDNPLSSTHCEACNSALCPPSADTPDVSTTVSVQDVNPVLIAGTSRMLDVTGGLAISTLPHVSWIKDPSPILSCLDDLKTNTQIRARIPKINFMITDVEVKALELKYEDLPVAIDDNEIVSLLAYTYDTQTGVPEGNLYQELNCSLRQREAAARQQNLTIWGTYMHYAMSAMQKLPDFSGV